MQVVMRTLVIFEGDESGELNERIREVVPQRVHTYQEMTLLAAMSGFNIHAAYGDMRLDVPLKDEDASRMLLVLKRQ